MIKNYYSFPCLAGVFILLSSISEDLLNLMFEICPEIVLMFENKIKGRLNNKRKKKKKKRIPSRLELKNTPTAFLQRNTDPLPTNVKDIKLNCIRW